MVLTTQQEERNNPVLVVSNFLVFSAVGFFGVCLKKYK